VRVRFLEDNIQLVVKSEGELIGVGQLSPGDQVTVKHDEYSAYDVTAALVTFPMRGPDGDVRYELRITATDSEPAANEDSRTVSFTEISLTDHQVPGSSTYIFRRKKTKINEYDREIHIANGLKKVTEMMRQFFGERRA
jgi:hypothetical protein